MAHELAGYRIKEDGAFFLAFADGAEEWEFSHDELEGVLDQKEFDALYAAMIAFARASDVLTDSKFDTRIPTQ